MTSPEPFVIEATVTPLQIDLGLGLNDLLTTLVRESQAAAQAALNPPLDPGVLEHLQKMGELAAQLQNELNQINVLDPTALDRLKQQQQEPAGS